MKPPRRLARVGRCRRPGLAGSAAAVVLLMAMSLASCGTPARIRHIALATTTSVDNSGLLNALVPLFRARTGVDIQLVTPGSGIALDMLERRDVDVVISHAPSREAAMLRNAGPWYYRKIMYNDFVLVGPPDDPARIRSAPDVAHAMRRLVESRVRFISRGDSSGTHERERDLWMKAGVAPSAEHLVVAGSGMGATLRIAATMHAYTLADRATVAPFAARGDLSLLFQGGGDLLNTYAVVCRADADAEVRAFAEWLADGDARSAIGGFKVVSGVPAFTVWPTGCPRELPSASPCLATEHTR